MREFTELGPAGGTRRAWRSRPGSSASTTASASSSTRSRAGATPATNGRSSRFTAPTCMRCCSRSVFERSVADAVVLGAKCVSFEENRSRVTAKFENGTSKAGAASIGCDGIHSAVRKHAVPRRGAARLPGHQHVARRDAHEALPHRRHHGDRRLAGSRQDGDLPDQERRRDGAQLVNWVAEIQSPRNVHAGLEPGRQDRGLLSGVRRTGASTGSTAPR